ncbi:MAG: multicopper oxidase domain-containing protein [Anaerolineae bacterium]|nr:multicopper oxidase domain-containing protein [Anaerolineae bacterium]
MKSGIVNPSVSRTILVFGVALLLVASLGLLPSRTSVYAQDDQNSGAVWVANEYDNSISVIDVNTNEVFTTLTGVAAPHNLQVAPDGRFVWAISGEDSMAIKIDATSYALMGTVSTGEHPAHIILTPDGSTVYVTNGGDNTVTAIDAETMAVVATIPVGESPHGARPSPDGQWIYVANANGTTLSVIETAANNRVADIEVGERPVQVAFSPDGAFVYVSLNGDNTLGKVEVATRTLVSTVEVGVGPIQVFVTPDNRYVLVANQGTENNPSTTLSIVDTETFTVINTVETGQGAHGVVVNPSGTFAYITNIYEDTVTVLDLTTQEVIAAIAVGSGPNGISFSALPAVVPSAQEIGLGLGQASSDGVDHNAHHASAEPTPTPAPALEGMGADGMDMMTMMQTMSGMMDSMMNMEMSDDMRAMMEVMRGMMNMMMSGDMMPGMDMMTMMQNMSAMMGTMMNMEMSNDMRAQMEDMQEMMGMMMSGEMMSGMGMMSPTAAPDAMAGMDMDGGHAMEPISSEGVPAATGDLGGQPLDYRLEDDVKVFDLQAEPVLWNILEDVTVTAWTYNGTVPGPMIRVTEGDRVRINFTNTLPEPTTLHFHGLNVPNAMDGVPGVTQEAVQPGETFVYEFEAQPVGTFMYHSHFDSDVQVSIGLYAPFIIDPAQAEAPVPDVDVTLMLSEWRVVDGVTYPAMPMAGSDPNYFTINGRAFPSTESITVQRGERVRLRLIGIGQFIHPMHLHGMPFEVVAIDGYPVPEGARQLRDTLSVAPGERYDVEFVATEAGTWMFHCHILHHVTNDGVEPGGLALVINVVE